MNVNIRSTEYRMLVHSLGKHTKLTKFGNLSDEILYKKRKKYQGTNTVITAKNLLKHWGNYDW